MRHFVLRASIYVRLLRNAFYFSYYDARMLEDSTWGFGLKSGIAAIKEAKCRNTLT